MSRRLDRAPAQQFNDFPTPDRPAPSPGWRLLDARAVLPSFRRATGESRVGNLFTKGGHAMSATGKECCHVCHSADYQECRWTNNRLVCAACARAIETSKGKVPAKQQTLNLAQVAQREGAQHGR
jgi:hypothetical protein